MLQTPLDSRSSADRQQPFDVAVVIQTVGRSTLGQAVESVFSQDLAGRIQLLIGVDQWKAGDASLLKELRQQCPDHIDLMILELGYATSRHYGGLYSNAYGGALRTILTYMANSRYVAYLDDDNWFAPNHLSSLVHAARGKAWAFSHRIFVDANSDTELCEDSWESMGPGKGVYGQAQGGFVDTSSILIDKLACHYAIPAWSEGPYQGGVGEDRHFFSKIKALPHGGTNLPTSYYRVALAGIHPYLLWRFKCAGVALEQFMAPDELPSEATWEECAAADSAKAAQPQGPGAQTGAARPSMRFF